MLLILSLVVSELLCKGLLAPSSHMERGLVYSLKALLTLRHKENTMLVNLSVAIRGKLASRLHWWKRGFALHLHSAFLVIQLLRALYITSQHSPIHTHIHTLTAGAFATRCRHAHQELIHTFNTDGAVVGSSLAFDVSPKDIWVLRLENQTANPLIIDDPLYLLSYSPSMWGHNNIHLNYNTTD